MLKKVEIVRLNKVLADATMLFAVETDLLDDEMFALDVENDVEDLLLENIIQEDGEEELIDFQENRDDDTEENKEDDEIDEEGYYDY